MAHKHQIIAHAKATRTGQHRNDRRQKRQALTALIQQGRAKTRKTKLSKPKLKRNKMPPEGRQYLKPAESAGDRLGDLLKQETP